VVRHGRRDLQLGVVVTELLLERATLVVQSLDLRFCLPADLLGGFGDDGWIAAKALDLLDDEPFDLAGGNRRRRALRPAAP
jgi:hypothetical protein